MEIFLNQIACQISQNPNHKTLYFINNKDGSPRWFWNAENPHPDFLKFYHISGFKAKMFSFIIRFIFLLRMQHLVFYFNKVNVKINFDNNICSYLKHHFSIFTGTEGPNRKLVLYANNKFIKIGLTNNSFEIIENEKNILNSISQGKYFLIPTPIGIKKGIVEYNNISKGGERHSEFTKTHALALNEIFNQFPIKNEILSLENKKTFDTSNINKKTPQLLLKKLEVLNIELKNKSFITGFAHKDFTPWNCYINQDKMMIYDFELADKNTVFGFDAFHFVMQQSILVEQLPWKTIKPKLKNAFQLMCEFQKLNDLDFELYLKLYLINNISNYISIYNNQEHWHLQIHWLFKTWNEALSDLLSQQNNKRQLLIGDTFDFLQNKKYATIKFPDINPLELPETKDIDILLSKTDAKSLLNYLSEHSLVKKADINTSSKMSSILCLLTDNSILALDLIWKLKRKSIQFLNTEEVLNRSFTNDYLIKSLNQEDTQTYLKYFYGLNNSSIPEQYLHYFENKTIAKLDKKALIKHLQLLPENKGLNFLKNQFLYFIDIFREIKPKKGFIITFSGVDGAGKSTIIEQTKEILTKKYRKNIVVIRHRPSILPILSAWTKGKKNAEKMAANSLPRQGKNNSFLSSLIRFTYYYIDYLTGQFYIYIKHVFRGKIVLYDRYYFDFINDSLRSNIQLPKSFTTFLYHFLLKPRFNFFLYADSATILSRKKELEAHTIEQLTNEYIALFKQLDQKSQSAYISIENIDLKTTLQTIISKTIFEIFKHEKTN